MQLVSVSLVKEEGNIRNFIYRIKNKKIQNKTFNKMYITWLSSRVIELSCTTLLFI